MIAPVIGEAYSKGLGVTGMNPMTNSAIGGGQVCNGPPAHDVVPHNNPSNTVSLHY